MASRYLWTEEQPNPEMLWLLNILHAMASVHHNRDAWQQLCEATISLFTVLGIIFRNVILILVSMEGNLFIWG